MAIYRALECNVPSLLKICQVVIFVFRSAKRSQDWKRTLSTCFLSNFIPFKGAGGIVEKASVNQRPSGHLWFSNDPKKHNLSRGR